MSSDTDLCRSTSLSYSSLLQYGCARQCTDVLESVHSSIYMCYNQFTFNTILASQKSSCTGYYSFVLYFNSQGMSLSSFKLLLSCLSRLKMLELLLYNQKQLWGKPSCCTQYCKLSLSSNQQHWPPAPGADFPSNNRHN